MGWNFVSNIARFHEVHAIVEEGEFKETLTKFAAEHPEAVEHITFHFVPRTHHNLLRKIWPPSYYWFYRAWHRKAYELAVELDKKENFDIVHQVTISGFRCPGYLWKLGKPFVWGPLGGFTDTPWCLLGSLGLGGAIHFAVRNIVNGFQKRWGREARAAAQHSAAILTSTTQAVDEIKRFWRKDAVLMNEVGLENTRARRASRHPYTSPAHRFASAGRVSTSPARLWTFCCEPCPSARRRWNCTCSARARAWRRGKRSPTSWGWTMW